MEDSCKIRRTFSETLFYGTSSASWNINSLKGDAYLKKFSKFTLWNLPPAGSNHDIFQQQSLRLTGLTEHSSIDHPGHGLDLCCRRSTTLMQPYKPSPEQCWQQFPELQSAPSSPSLGWLHPLPARCVPMGEGAVPSPALLLLLGCLRFCTLPFLTPSPHTKAGRGWWSHNLAPLFLEVSFSNLAHDLQKQTTVHQLTQQEMCSRIKDGAACFPSSVGFFLVPSTWFFLLGSFHYLVSSWSKSPQGYSTFWAVI